MVFSFAESMCLRRKPEWAALCNHLLDLALPPSLPPAYPPGKYATRIFNAEVFPWSPLLSTTGECNLLVSISGNIPPRIYMDSRVKIHAKCKHEHTQAPRSAVEPV